MLWMDKFCLATGTFRRWTRRARDLEVVDLIAWNKLRPGMGRRARCVTEYLVVAQKAPTRAKSVWTDHGIRDSWSESSDRRIHPHAKPHVLTERLIRACTKRDDLVVDPCAGGYGVMEACRASRRQFLGGDLI
jgi:site-specific DNA-methyltransferase (adenine-specific)